MFTKRQLNVYKNNKHQGIVYRTVNVYKTISCLQTSGH